MRPGEIDLDLDLRDLFLKRGVQIDDTRNIFEGLQYFCGLLLQNGKFETEDAHDDGLGRAR